MGTSDISREDVKELIRDKTGKNTTESAVKLLEAIIETFAGDIAEEAIHLAEQDGREKVTAGDVKRVLEA